ncbi:MAG: hypothetical protein JRI45_04865 [Deltaproteobacteria bacterium]|nr:hypothetical protein [Deltaproteobacteria bacterium]MBW2068773.1 hypothetical protein [Deltaproteobacteria bacterium]
MTLTEIATTDLAAQTSQVRLPEHFGEKYFETEAGQRKCDVQGWPMPAPWVRLVLSAPEENMSYRSTEIIFPEVTEDFVPRTPLGRKLLSLRMQAIQAGMRLLNADEVLEEVRRRRGEVQDNEADLR